MSDLLITHVDVLTDEGVLKNHAIAINNGYITAILNDSEAEKVKVSAKEVLDGKGQLATPGLVNTHTHIAMGLFRNYADDLELMEWLETAIWPTEAKLNDDYVRYGTQLGIAEMLRTGTTTFSDMYFFMNTTAEVVKETGIRSVLSRGLAGVSPTADQALVENADLFRTWNGFDNDRIKVLLGPHAPYTTLAAHCVHVTDEDMAIMSENNVAVAHNPQSNLKLASGIAPVPEMIAKGITVGLGTDGSASNNNADMLEEVRLAATLHKARLYDPKAIPAQAAWNMGTVEGAKALGYTDLGVLDKGYRADIVLYDVSGMHWMPRYNDLAALVYSANSSDVNTTIVGGKVLMKDKELLTIDEEKLRAEIDKAQVYFSN